MKSMIIFLLCLTAQPVLRGQEKPGNHHFYGSVGAGSLHTWGMDLALSGLGALFTNSSVETESTPIYTVGYQYSLSPKFRIGTELIHHRIAAGSVDPPDRLSFTNIFVRTDYTWVQKRKWRWSSGLSGGCVFMRGKNFLRDEGTTENQAAFTGHLYLLSCDYSFDRVAVFLNLGAGASGFVNTGISVGF
jgi:hypothetical protein